MRKVAKPLAMPHVWAIRLKVATTTRRHSLKTLDVPPVDHTGGNTHTHMHTHTHFSTRLAACRSAGGTDARARSSRGDHKHSLYTGGRGPEAGRRSAQEARGGSGGKGGGEEGARQPKAAGRGEARNRGAQRSEPLEGQQGKRRTPWAAAPEESAQNSEEQATEGIQTGRRLTPRPKGRYGNDRVPRPRSTARAKTLTQPGRQARAERGRQRYTHRHTHAHTHTHTHSVCLCEHVCVRRRMHSRTSARV